MDAPSPLPSGPRSAFPSIASLLTTFRSCCCPEVVPDEDVGGGGLTVLPEEYRDEVGINSDNSRD